MSLCTPFVDTSVGRVTVHTSGARPTGLDLYEGKLIWESDTNKLMIYDGLGEWREVFDIDGWATWNPVLSGSGYAIGNGAIGGLSRVRPDKSYEYLIVLLWGSTSTSGAGPMTLSTPATFLNTNIGATGVGHTDLLVSSTSGGSMFDTSASDMYDLRLNYASTTTVVVQASQYNGAAAGVAYNKWVNASSTIPVAPATGDIFRLFGSGFAL